jgi:hypothetical protein
VGDKRNAYRIFVGKRKGKRPFGRYSRSREDNINGATAIGWEGVDCDRANDGLWNV